MVRNPESLINAFREAALKCGLQCPVGIITHEAQYAPHKPHSLPPGKGGVYVFSLSSSWGKLCPAGPDRVLKIGKAGPKSNARFQSQHYGVGRADSTLAGTLVESRLLWPYLGIEGLEDAGEWIKCYCDRDNFYLDAAYTNLLAHLERYIRATVGSVFEG